MKNLKNIFAAIILLSTLTTSALTASHSMEIESNCFFNGPVLSLEIPALNISTDIQLLHNTYEAPVTIVLWLDRAAIEIVIDGTNAIVTGDGINALVTGDGINNHVTGDGINNHASLVTGDGINALITGDGINELITGDGINTLTVSQFGSVLYSNAR